jgi:hypothetical protein
MDSLRRVNVRSILDRSAAPPRHRGVIGGSTGGRPRAVGGARGTGRPSLVCGPAGAPLTASAGGPATMSGPSVRRVHAEEEPIARRLARPRPRRRLGEHLRPAEWLDRGTTPAHGRAVGGLRGPPGSGRADPAPQCPARAVRRLPLAGRRMVVAVRLLRSRRPDRDPGRGGSGRRAGDPAGAIAGRGACGGGSPHRRGPAADATPDVDSAGPGPGSPDGDRPNPFGRATRDAPDAGGSGARRTGSTRRPVLVAASSGDSPRAPARGGTDGRRPGDDGP